MRSSRGESRGSRHRPPPWWPEGEGWPPRYQGWKPGPRPGGRGPTPNPWPHFGRWLVRLVLVTVAAGLLLPLVLGVVLATTIGGWTSVGIAALSWAAIALIIAIGLRLGLRQLRPIRSLIDTAGRLADGDYTARVANSSPPLEPVVSSFNRMAERLESAEEQRRRLLADVGHELRTPLTIVRGELEAMADGVRQLDEAQIRLLLTDLATVERLLDDLQTLSTAEAGTLRIHREPTDLVTLTRQATGRLTPDHDRSGVGVDVGVTVTVEARTGDDPLEADVDPVRIREVVANLVANAIRATEAPRDQRTQCRSPTGGHGAGGGRPGGRRWAGRRPDRGHRQRGRGAGRRAGPCLRSVPSGGRDLTGQAWASPSPATWWRPTTVGSPSTAPGARARR